MNRSRVARAQGALVVVAPRPRGWLASRARKQGPGCVLKAWSWRAPMSMRRARFDPVDDSGTRNVLSLHADCRLGGRAR